MRLDGVEVKVSLDSDQTAAAVQALDLADGAAWKIWRARCTASPRRRGPALRRRDFPEAHLPVGRSHRQLNFHSVRTTTSPSPPDEEKTR